MAARIVLFGATGYTGRLAAEAMVERGLQPVLAARTQSKLDELAAELGGDSRRGPPTCPTRRAWRRWSSAATCSSPPSGRSPAGASPQRRRPPRSSAHYIDSTGEPQFIREVFERYGPPAERAGIGMLTAMGYDWVPGNLAGGARARPRRRAGHARRRRLLHHRRRRAAERRHAGLARRGHRRRPHSASATAGIQTERGAKRVRSFRVGSKDLSGISVGSSEHFTLPRLASRAARGERLPRLVRTGVAGDAGVLRVHVGGHEGAGSGEAAGPRRRSGSCRAPPAARTRRRARSRDRMIVAIAYDASGRELTKVQLRGVDGYTFTGRMLAWAAERAASGGLKATGALGPVDGFGLAELTAGAAEAGIAEEGGPDPAARRSRRSVHRSRQRRRSLTESREIGRRRLAALAGAALGALILGAAVGSGDGGGSEGDAAAATTQQQRDFEAAREAVDRLTLRQQVGQVTISSFPGTTRPEYIRRRLRAPRDGRRDPVRRRNGGDAAHWRRLTRSLQRGRSRPGARHGRPGGRRHPHGGARGAARRASPSRAPRPTCAGRRAPPAAGFETRA